MNLPEIPKWFLDQARAAGKGKVSIRHLCDRPDERRLLLCRQDAGLDLDLPREFTRDESNCSTCEMRDVAVLSIEQPGARPLEKEYDAPTVWRAGGNFETWLRRVSAEYLTGEGRKRHEAALRAVKRAMAQFSEEAEDAQIAEIVKGLGNRRLEVGRRDFDLKTGVITGRELGQ